MSAPGGRIILSAIDPVINDNGNLSANAVITIYQTGTSNLASIYSDQTLSTGVTNPQITNQDGRAYSQTTAFFADVNAALDVHVQMPTGETYSYLSVWPQGQAPSFSGFLSNPNVQLTGNPTAPTPVTSDVSSSIATTAFVNNKQATIQVFPAGMICPFGMQSLPNGWLTCDGSAVSRSTYPALFAAVGTTWGAGDGSSTFNVPNFMGQFLRGLDTGGSIDPGRSFASSQADAFQGFTVTFGTSQTDTSGHRTPYSSGGDNPVYDNTGPAPTSGPVSDGTHGTPRMANETRPVNVAVVYGIRT